VSLWVIRRRVFRRRRWPRKELSCWNGSKDELKRSRNVQDMGKTLRTGKNIYLSKPELIQDSLISAFSNSQRASLDDLRTSQTLLLSQSLPTSYTPPPPSKATPPGTPLRRGAFTRAEYERRHQLKIMADLGKVLKQKPAKHSGKKQHVHKPHNNHELTHTRSPGKNKTGNRTSPVYLN